MCSYKTTIFNSYRYLKPNFNVNWPFMYYVSRFWDFFWPTHSLCKHDLYTDITSKNCHLNPPIQSSAYVIVYIHIQLHNSYFPSNFDVRSKTFECGARGHVLISTLFALIQEVINQINNIERFGKIIHIHKKLFE